MAPPEPRLIEAFFQVNLHEGFGFLDTRGRLTKAFGEPFQGVQELIENGLSTVHLFGAVKPSFPVVELKFTIATIWMHFGIVSTRVAIRQEGSRVVREACEIMGVTRFSRQGLRTQLIFPTENAADAVELVRSQLVPRSLGWDALGNVESAGSTLRLAAPPLTANISLQPVQRAKIEVFAQMGEPTPAPPTEGDDGPRFGIMLDVDIFDDRLSESSDSKPHLNKAVEFLDGSLIPLVAKLLEGGK